MERSVDIDTGESVAFRYELAGVGSRFLAVLIDTGIQVAILLAFALLIGMNGWLIELIERTLPKHWQTLMDSLIEATAALFVFLLFFGYFIAFEWLWNGKTPGKRIVGIRVVRDGGLPLDFFSSTTRNTVRMLEFALGFYAVSAIVALLSPRNRRLGDLAAGTIVVRDERMARTAFTPDSREDDLATRNLSVDERDLIKRYVDRRESLTPEARNTIAGRIAGTIRPKLTASFGHLDDDALLEHLARVPART